MKTNLKFIGKCEGSVLNIKNKNKKEDISIKYLWEVLNKNQGIESGYFFGIDYRDRHCITVSTQQGCLLSKINLPCKFCITGQQKFFGQLNAKQILQQVLFLALSNKVSKKGGRIEVAFMGMGEPGLNYEEVAKSIEYLESFLPKLKMQAIRYIFSTIGIPNILEKLGKDISSGRFGTAKIRLHLSLHSHTNKMRDEIVPINTKYPISQIFKSIRKYIKEIEKVPWSDKKISINYMMFNNFESKEGTKFTTINKKSMKELSELLNDPKHFRPVLCEFNESWTKNDPVNYSTALELKRYLTSKNYDTKIFGSFGHTVKLACGQLSGKLDQKNMKKPTVNDIRLIKKIDKIIENGIKKEISC